MPLSDTQKLMLSRKAGGVATGASTGGSLGASIGSVAGAPGVLTGAALGAGVGALAGGIATPGLSETQKAMLERIEELRELNGLSDEEYAVLRNRLIDPIYSERQKRRQQLLGAAGARGLDPGELFRAEQSLQAGELQEISEARRIISAADTQARLAQQREIAALELGQAAEADTQRQKATESFYDLATSAAAVAGIYQEAKLLEEDIITITGGKGSGADVATIADDIGYVGSTYSSTPPKAQLPGSEEVIRAGEVQGPGFSGQGATRTLTPEPPVDEIDLTQEEPGILPAPQSPAVSPEVAALGMGTPAPVTAPVQTFTPPQAAPQVMPEPVVVPSSTQPLVIPQGQVIAQPRVFAPSQSKQSIEHELGIALGQAFVRADVENVMRANGIGLEVIGSGNHFNLYEYVDPYTGVRSNQYIVQDTVSDLYYYVPIELIGE